MSCVLLEPATGGSVEQGVAVKMVASISPVDGNNPSFTVAQIDPESAKLKDYKVFAASNQTGVDTTWAEEYDFDKSYNQAEFSAASIKKLIAGFRRRGSIWANREEPELYSQLRLGRDFARTAALLARLCLRAQERRRRCVCSVRVLGETVRNIGVTSFRCCSSTAECSSRRSPPAGRPWRRSAVCRACR